MRLSPGDPVSVRVYGGAILGGRRVVEAHARGVLVTSEREWAAAIQEDRDPMSVGFPVEDVFCEQCKTTEPSEGEQP